MNEGERKRKLIVGLAELYGEAMTVTRLGIYAQVLDRLSADKLEQAILVLAQNPTVTRLPLPAAILEAAEPTMTVDDAAQSLLLRSIEAVRKCGPYQREAARKFVGDFVWETLENFGWEQFCMEGNSIGARAQLRDAFRGRLKNTFPTGRVTKLPELAKPKVRESLTLTDRGWEVQPTQVSNTIMGVLETWAPGKAGTK